MELSALGRCYRSFLRCLSLISKFPYSIAYYLAPLLANYGFSPISHEEPLVKQAVSDTGQSLSATEWRQFWHKRLADHAIFCLNIFKNASFDEAWVKKYVTFDKASLQAIDQNKSILFLTYHNPYSHTLCVALGSSGWRVNPFVAAEETSPIFDFVGRYIKKLHAGCMRHFNGGKYLFFDQNSVGASLTRRALADGGILVATNDILNYSKKAPTIKFMGRLITPPIGNVKLACRMGIPIVAGLMVRDGEHYKIVYRQLDSHQSIEQIMTEYFDFLTELLAKYPAFWDGWNWFSSLPLDSAENTNE
ncbi:MAG: hypothetical protein methR_PLP0004 (plasmid) [Methyloprofundus sp.]|nr:MAG: hypothetical protein methR_PLP0004 [Methyloprofundus sp.]